MSQLQRLLYLARHELKEQERISELHQLQIRFLKQEITNMTKNFRLATNLEDEKLLLNSGLLKETLIRLVSMLPMLNSEGEGLLSILLSFLNVELCEIEKINFHRKSGKFKLKPRLACIFS